MPPRPFRVTETGVVVQVRVTPNAGEDAVAGCALRDDGSAILQLRVKAVPDKGRANAAAAALMARTLGVPKSAVSLISGATARLKSFSVAGPADELAENLDRLCR